jgi:hypothetical protein
LLRGTFRLLDRAARQWQDPQCGNRKCRFKAATNADQGAERF